MTESRMPPRPSDLLFLSPEDEDALVRKAGKLVASSKFASLEPRNIPAYFDVSPDQGDMKPLVQDFFTRVVNAAWLAHLSGKGVSVASVVSEDRALPPLQVKQLLSTPRFKQACKARGIPQSEIDHLSPEMIAALRIVSDATLEGMSERQRVQSLGIKWQEYQGWMDYPPFREKYKTLMGKALEVAADRADLKLAELVESGNFRAIEYVNEKTGRFVRGQQERQDFQQLVVMVLSAVARHVTDPQALEAVSEDLGQLIALPVSTPAQDVVEAEVVDGDDDYEHPGPDSGNSGDERAV